MRTSPLPNAVVADLQEDYRRIIRHETAEYRSHEVD
jgi:hypothetical protein